MLNKMMILLVTSTLLSNIAFAEVIHLAPNEKAPFAGYLFPEDKAKEVRDGLIERDGFKLINESLEKSLVLEKTISLDLTKKVDILSNTNTDLAKNLFEERQSSNWAKIGWFALGCISTGFLYSVVSKTAK